MASLTLKNIPDDLLDRLRELASGRRRSLTQQALVLLERALAADEYEAEKQVAAWRSLAGRWQSTETTAQEVAAVCDARTPGRDVEL